MAKKVKYITRGAVMICENGSKKVLLDIPEGHGVYIGVQPNAMRFDCKPGENVKGFGKCSAADYHKSSKVTGIDKALSFGILDIGQDCVLDLLPEWFICDENQIITQEYEEGKANPVPQKMSVQNMEEFSEVLRARDSFNDVDSRSWISRVGDTIGGNNILSYDEVQSLESQIAATKSGASNLDEEKYLLTMDSILVCRCGGVIKFETSGQEYTDEDFDVTVTLQDKDVKKTPEQLEKEKETVRKKETQEMQQAIKDEIKQRISDDEQANKIIDNLNIKDMTSFNDLMALQNILGILSPTEFYRKIRNGEYEYAWNVSRDDYETMGYLPDDTKVTEENRSSLEQKYPFGMARYKTMKAIHELPHASPIEGNIGSEYFDAGYYASLGWQHTGIDYPGNSGRDIRATTGGSILSFDDSYTGSTFGTRDHGPGNCVYIQDFDGNKHIYAHMTHPSDKVLEKGNGYYVLPGELIGTSGNTGNSSGAHLHYEIQNSSGRWGSSANSVNPHSYLPNED